MGSLQYESASSGYGRAATLALAWFLLGCNGGPEATGTPTSTSSKTAPTRITIQAEGTTFKSGQPAILKTYSSLQQYELSFDGVSQTERPQTWSALATLTGDQVRSGSATVAVTIGATSTGPGARRLAVLGDVSSVGRRALRSRAAGASRGRVGVEFAEFVSRGAGTGAGHFSGHAVDADRGATSAKLSLRDVLSVRRVVDVAW